MIELINQLHHEAMEFMDDGDAARRAGNEIEARLGFKRAAILEMAAADLASTMVDSEPSCEVLKKSAEALAQLSRVYGVNHDI